MGVITNFYNFSSRLFIFGAHIPPKNYACCEVSLMCLTYFLSYDFLFLEMTYIQNLSSHTNFKYMIQDFFHNILDTSRKRLTIDISEICPEKKEKIFFLLICEIFGPYYVGFIFYFEKWLTYKKTELNVQLTIPCRTCRKKFELDSLKIVEAFAF